MGVADAPDIRAVHRERGIVMLDNGDLVPVYMWLDADGHRCSSADAYSGCAGPYPWPSSSTGSVWFAFFIHDYCSAERSRATH